MSKKYKEKYAFPLMILNFITKSIIRKDVEFINPSLIYQQGKIITTYIYRIKKFFVQEEIYYGYKTRQNKSHILSSMRITKNVIDFLSFIQSIVQ